MPGKQGTQCMPITATIIKPLRRVQNCENFQYSHESLKTTKLLNQNSLLINKTTSISELHISRFINIQLNQQKKSYSRICIMQRRHFLYSITKILKTHFAYTSNLPKQSQGPKILNSDLVLNWRGPTSGPQRKWGFKPVKANPLDSNRYLKQPTYKE